MSRSGTVASGDVELFFTLFGEPGGTPVLVVHGANYYDSRDWANIAADLATEREVAAYDLRGFGRSGWSPSQDYSLDAHLLDIMAVLDHLAWPAAILVGHSRGGSFALRFAHEHADLVAGIALVDFSPAPSTSRPGGGSPSPPEGAYGPVYASLEQAHAATSRDPGELTTDAGRARAESIFERHDGGWVNISRDPAFRNARPSGHPDWTSSLAPLDLWDALAGLVHAELPVLVVRGTRSHSYDESALTRLRSDFPSVEVAEVNSGHDVPGGAPAELIAALRPFLHRPK